MVSVVTEFVVAKTSLAVNNHHCLENTSENANRRTIGSHVTFDVLLGPRHSAGNI